MSIDAGAAVSADLATDITSNLLSEASLGTVLLHSFLFSTEHQSLYRKDADLQFQARAQIWQDAHAFFLP